MAVVDCPVGLMEEAGDVQEIARARAFEAVLSPFDLGCRAAPSLALEYRPEALGEFPVEARVVCDDDHCIGHESRDSRLVDASSRNHFVRDAGERGDLLR